MPISNRQCDEIVGPYALLAPNVANGTLFQVHLVLKRSDTVIPIKNTAVFASKAKEIPLFTRGASHGLGPLLAKNCANFPSFLRISKLSHVNHDLLDTPYSTKGCFGVPLSARGAVSLMALASTFSHP